MKGALLEHLDELGDVARIGNQAQAGAQAHGKQAHREREDVIQRQRGHDMGLFGLDPAIECGREPAMRLQRGGHDIAMGQHRAFGQARGAARVLQKSRRVEGGIAGCELEVCSGGQGLVEWCDLALFAT